MSSNPGFPVLPLPVTICHVHGPHVLYPRNAISSCPGAPIQSLQTTGLATQGPAFCVEPWPETTATDSRLTGWQESFEDFRHRRLVGCKNICNWKIVDDGW